MAWPSTTAESRPFIDQLHEWATTVDHKRLGILYMVYALVFLVIGGIEASGSLLQRRLDLPDATTLVLQGLLFANLLAWEALGGRIAAWRVKLQAVALADAATQLEQTHA